MSLLPTGTPELPDSPFIPGTRLQFAWDSVSLTAAMACWRRYQLMILEGLQPKGPNRAIALDFGIAFHKAMEHYHNFQAAGASHTTATHHTVAVMTSNPHYAKLPTHDHLAEEATDVSDEDKEADDGIYTRNARVRTRYHLMRAVVWYLEHYADDPARTLVQPSGAAAVELSFRIPLPVQVGGQEMVLSGHIDRAVEFQGSYYVSDYKSTKSLSRQFFADFELSHQLSGYSLAGEVILDKPIAGIIVDAIALLQGGAKFQRHITKRTPGQQDEYLETVQNTMDEAERHHASGSYPMNTSACYFCQFKDLCNKPPEYRDSYKRVLFDSVPPWNPLENR